MAQFKIVIPPPVIATISPEDLDECRNYMIRSRAFREVHHCDQPCSEDDFMNCTSALPAFEAEKMLLWQRLAEKYGFDIKEQLILDLNNGNIHLENKK